MAVRDDANDGLPEQAVGPEPDRLSSNTDLTDWGPIAGELAGPRPVTVRRLANPA